MFVFCSPEATGVWSSSKSWAGGREGGREGEGGALGGGVKCTIIDGDFFFFYTSSDGVRAHWLFPTSCRSADIRPVFTARWLQLHSPAKRGWRQQEKCLRVLLIAINMSRLSAKFLPTSLTISGLTRERRCCEISMRFWQVTAFSHGEPTHFTEHRPEKRRRQMWHLQPWPWLAFLNIYMMSSKSVKHWVSNFHWTFQISDL